MLLDMQIYMPSQDPLAEEDSAFTPRNVRRWIKTAPLANLRLVSTELIELLATSNRVSYSGKQRFTSLEYLIPTCQSYLSQYRKLLSHQTFPLSEAAEEVYCYQQSLLSELAIAYKIMIAEAVNGDNSLSEKKLFLCFFRSIFYLKQQYICSVLTYQKVSDTIWPDICQLYRASDFYNFINHTYHDREIGEKTEIENTFKYLCSLSMITFNKLRQGEASKLVKFLNKNCNLIEVKKELDSINEDYIYVANLATGKTPTYYIPRELPISSENRFILYSLFINKLSELKQKYVQSHSYYLNTDDEIDPDLANRLISMIGQPTQRSKKRLKSNQIVKAIVGLEQIIGTLDPNKSVDIEDPLNEDSQSIYNLGLIAMEKKASNIFQRVDFNEYAKKQAKLESQNLSAVWEPFSLEELTDDKLQKPDENSNKRRAGTWKVENYSSGGFCLNYDSDGSCRIRVGEIIAIRDINNADQTIKWLTGTIRWMQSTPRESSRIGVELFGAECALISAQCKNDNAAQYKGLLLKRIQDNQRKFSLLVPTRVSFETNDIVLYGKKSERNTILGQTLEKTSSFTHFEIIEISNRNKASGKA